MADYEGVLADLKAKRAALDRERERLEMAITAIEPLVSAIREETRPVSPRAFAGLNMPQALVKYAKVAQQPQTTSQVAGALRAGGMRASAKSFNNQVYNILTRLSKADGPWQRDTDGRWSTRTGPTAQPSNPEQVSLITRSTH